MDAPPVSFTHGHAMDADGRIHFRCSQDMSVWPWLALPPSHPVVVQVANYWISVECSTFRGTFDPNKWSALVWTEWHCGDVSAGHPVRGTMAPHGEEEKLGFAIELFDAQDRPAFAMKGRGVVFRTRNFEGWRGETKSKLAYEDAAAGFTYASREAVGAGPREFAFLAPIDSAATPSARGLIVAANGLPPAHPFISASGDHVNAAHIAEAARQFVALLKDDPGIRITAGEITFKHYVEIGVPFVIELETDTDNSAAMVLSQNDRECSKIRLDYAA